MKKTLSRYGNSLALIIDKPILELLNITGDTVLPSKTDGTQLIITPEHVADADDKAKNNAKKVRKAIEEVMEEYAEGFKRLADSQGHAEYNISTAW